MFAGRFHGDVFLLLKLLLPGVIKAVYNLQDKQIVKCFSVIFDVDLDEMIEDLEQGDVAETVALFFDNSNNVKPQKKSTLSLQEVTVKLRKCNREWHVLEGSHSFLLPPTRLSANCNTSAGK